MSCCYDVQRTASSKHTHTETTVPPGARNGNLHPQVPEPTCPSGIHQQRLAAGVNRKKKGKIKKRLPNDEHKKEEKQNTKMLTSWRLFFNLIICLAGWCFHFMTCCKLHSSNENFPVEDFGERLRSNNFESQALLFFLAIAGSLGR